MHKVRSGDFDVDDSGDDMSIGSPLLDFPRPRQSSAESIPSDNRLVASLFDALSFKKDEPESINFFTYLVLSFYSLRALMCWSEEKCQYEPLDDLGLLLLANLDVTWSHDIHNVIDYLANPRRLVRNYNSTIRSSSLALTVRMYGSYQMQQYIGTILESSKVSPLVAQLVACCALEAYSKAFVAMNTRLRSIEEKQPITPPVLFRQFTGEHDNSSDDGFDFSNPNTPSGSPSHMFWPSH